MLPQSSNAGDLPSIVDRANRLCGRPRHRFLIHEIITVE
jgi:hypothetical protein